MDMSKRSERIGMWDYYYFAPLGLVKQIFLQTFELFLIHDVL